MLGPAHHCRDRLSQGSGSPLLESFDCGEWACGAPSAWPEGACDWVCIVVGFCGALFIGLLLYTVTYNMTSPVKTSIVLSMRVAFLCSAQCMKTG